MLNSNMRGAVAMVVAMASFGCGDAVSKTLFADMLVGQLMLLRGLFASILIWGLAWYSGALRRPWLLLHPMVALRILFECGGTIAFLIGLTMMPLGTIAAIMQALPLAVTSGAALFLKEPVGWRRWTAIGIGFAGMLLIVRPDAEGFNTYAVWPLLCVALSAARDLTTSRVPAEIPTLLLSAGTATAVMLMGGGVALIQGQWSPLTASSTVFLIMAAVFLLVGHQATILATRGSDISFVAPFRYTSLLWGLLFGYLIFGEVPAPLMILGSAIIVASGIYTLYRETVVNAIKPVAASTRDAGTPDGF